MAALPTIALHLGVHKTASTYLQTRLYNSRELLSENDVSYIPLDILRRSITSKFINDDFSSENMLDFLKPYLECHRLILSEENFIGDTRKPKTNSIYHNSKSRISKLLALLGEFQVEVYITLRNYPDYFVSRYSESLRFHKFINFEQYYSEINFETVTWLDVVENIKMAGAKIINIADFNDIFTNEKDYLFKLLGNEHISLIAADASPAIRRSKIEDFARSI